MAGFVVENRRGLIVGADLTQKVFPHPANALTLTTLPRSCPYDEIERRTLDTIEVPNGVSEGWLGLRQPRQRENQQCYGHRRVPAVEGQYLWLVTCP